MRGEKDTRFPHVCPACKSPAYMGCVPAAVDCSSPLCRHASQATKAAHTVSKKSNQEMIDTLSALLQSLNAAYYGAAPANQHPTMAPAVPGSQVPVGPPMPSPFGPQLAPAKMKP